MSLIKWKRYVLVRCVAPNANLQYFQHIDEHGMYHFNYDIYTCKHFPSEQAIMKLLPDIAKQAKKYGLHFANIYKVETIIVY